MHLKNCYDWIKQLLKIPYFMLSYSQKCWSTNTGRILHAVFFSGGVPFCYFHFGSVFCGWTFTTNKFDIRDISTTVLMWCQCTLYMSEMGQSWRWICVVTNFQAVTLVSDMAANLLEVFARVFRFPSTKWGFKTMCCIQSIYRFSQFLHHLC